DRVEAMRKLFARALQSGRFIAPFFVGVELRCASGAPARADLTGQLRALSERGDPMAFVLLGHELEQSAQGNPAVMAEALENYGIAGRLLLGQRENLQRKQVLADQSLVKSLEEAVNLRRVKLAERLDWSRLADTFQKVEGRLRKLQTAQAQAGADGIK